jgi:methyl-accepting chemotaxis protein
MQVRITKLRTKFFLYFLVPVALIFLISIILTGLRNRSKNFTDAQKMTQSYAAQYANLIQGITDSYISTGRTLTNIFENYESIPQHIRRPQLANILRISLENNSEFLSVWSICDTTSIDRLDHRYKNTVGSSILGNFRYIYYKDEETVQLSKYIEQDPDEVLSGKLFNMVRNSKKEMVVDPYYYSYTGSKDDEILQTNIVFPLLENGNFLGMLGIDFQLESFKNIVDTIEVLENSYAILCSNNGTIIAHPQAGLSNTNIANSKPFSEATNFSAQKIVEGQSFTVTGNDSSGTEMLCAFAPIHIGKTESPWSLAIVVPKKVIFKSAENSFRFSLFVGLIGLTILSILILFIARNLTRPIVDNIKLAQQLAKGKIYFNDKQKIRTDEIGQLTLALKRMAETLKGITENIVSGARHTLAASQQFSDTSQSLSQGAGELASSTEELSSSVEEVSASISNNGELAKDAAGKTHSGIQQIKALNTTALKTKAANQTISSKIQIIDEIAFQTNLLSLNASIVAAKAGNNGKAFNVVAQEVRKLAEQSQKAANEIIELAEESLLLSQKTENDLKIITPGLEEAGSMVEKVKEITLQQQIGIDEIKNAIHQINKISQHNSATSEQIASSSEELYGQSKSLTELTEYFETEEN